MRDIYACAGEGDALPQKDTMFVFGYPKVSKFFLHANSTMGGGPHINTKLSLEGGGRHSLIISTVMKPFRCFQPAGGKSNV
mmetsp:Transcript_125111/g.350336  ORF Transcript_125111/g.350336 Transcript_125111/m.350336 type:complete len:81 (-) Transcript_125111:832-1074(-)